MLSLSKVCVPPSAPKQKTTRLGDLSFSLLRSAGEFFACRSARRGMCERGTFAGSPFAFYLGTGFPFLSSFAFPYQLQNKKPPDWVVSCFGADDQIRTDYLVLTKDALYLLSYISELAGAEGFEPSARGFGDHCSTS